MYRMQNHFLKQVALAGALLGIVIWKVPADIKAAPAESLITVTEESQIHPIPDGSGKYLLKSDGFYCLNQDGTLENVPAVHYFDHFVIDGTTFNGYYYHDETGKFRAENPHMVHIQIPARPDAEIEEMTISFDGYFMVNNLGKLSAAPQVRYMDNLVLNNTTFNGYYYFDEFGELETEPGIHYLEMTSNGQQFAGRYYFGGVNGLLEQKEWETPEGFMTDETGRLQDMDDLGIKNLKTKLEEIIKGYQGDWSIYVKDLNSQETLEINNKPLYSASLIKAFVLADSYDKMENIKKNEGLKIKMDPDSAQVKVKLDDLLWNMIAVSDNESFNELVRLQSEKSDFAEGAEKINEYLKQEGYKDTSVQHTLSPSSSPSTGLGGKNITSVKDCGLLLEKIYREECVNEEASRDMLNILLDQEVDWKIPKGLEEGITVANKTGETDTSQHDIAIIYGEKTTYILCVMSENSAGNTAIHNIQDISRIVYYYLNL